MGMTFEEKGAYMDLLMMQFNRGHMTSHMIGQMIGQIWDNLKDKFIQDEKGLWYNKRLEEEQLKRKAFSESRRNNIEGINQYSKQPKKTAHMTSHMENENESIIKNEIEKNIFEEIRKLYPGTKRGLETEFDNFKKKHSDWKEILTHLKPDLENQILARKKSTGFIPQWANFATWINQSKFEEVFIITKDEKKSGETTYTPPTRLING